MDNLVAEAFDFSKAVYEEKFIDPGKQGDIWLDNYLPVLYVLYLKYIEHYYNELNYSDIDKMCDEFGNIVSGGGEISPELAKVVGHMKITNRELDKIIPQIRQMGADYSDAWAMCFYYLYGQNVNADGAVKLLHVVEKISGYRKNVNPRVTNNKDVFIRVANDIASIVKKTILGKNESIVCPEGYFVGFGLFCVKYYVSHSVAIDIANHYLNTSDYRGYISQTFIRNVIQSIYHNDAKDATDCYTMWNHLNKVLKSISGNSVESSKQLIMALVTFVSALQITDDKEQQELVLILNSNMSNYLNSISIDFH